MERTFFTEKKDIRKQNTGWITKYEADWMRDFFMSKKIYLFENNELNPIVIDEVTAETSTQKNLIAFEFTYRPAEMSDYLNLKDISTANTGNYWNDSEFWNDNNIWND
ncbi:MAG: hypothetical protein LBP63_09000 [Prevotellaceae bacterium]|nr:hypothetical protein [Prevotellaceae bacterium]